MILAKSRSTPTADTFFVLHKISRSSSPRPQPKVENAGMGFDPFPDHLHVDRALFDVLGHDRV